MSQVNGVGGFTPTQISKCRPECVDNKHIGLFCSGVMRLIIDTF